MFFCFVLFCFLSIEFHHKFGMSISTKANNYTASVVWLVSKFLKKKKTFSFFSPGGLCLRPSHTSRLHPLLCLFYVLVVGDGGEAQKKHFFFTTCQKKGKEKFILAHHVSACSTIISPSFCFFIIKTKKNDFLQSIISYDVHNNIPTPKQQTTK